MSDPLANGPAPDDRASNDREFDEALVAGAFRIAALDGWRAVSVAAAAREAGLPLARARARFPGRAAILLRFGSLADQEALGLPPSEDHPREHLFDLLMRRFDALQRHREGVIALLRGLPAAPATAALLAVSTLRSMAWMLEASSLSARGPVGGLRAQGLLGVWLYAVRAWERDDSPDLAGTMAALDKALARAAQVEGWWQGRRDGPEDAIPDFPPDPEPEPSPSAIATLPLAPPSEPFGSEPF